VRDSACQTFPLVCPACREVTAAALSLYTVAVEASTDDKRAGDTLLDGQLRCQNPACRRSYPVVDGVPLLVPDLPRLLGTEVAQLLDGQLSFAVAASLVEAGDDQAPLPRLWDHVSIYADAHWADLSDPPSPTGGAALWAKLAARASAPVARAVELGASLGRGVAELCSGADSVVGVDLHVGAMRRARQILDGVAVTWGRRHLGRHYRAVRTARPATAKATFVVGDALDPPLAPGAFDRVVALNLLDSLRSPRGLLSVMDGLCAPGGELILASPFAWSSQIVDEGERVGREDPAAWLISRLTSGEGLSCAYTVDDRDELSWSLRRDDRSTTTYRTFYVRATKR